MQEMKKKNHGLPPMQRLFNVVSLTNETHISEVGIGGLIRVWLE